MMSISNSDIEENSGTQTVNENEQKSDSIYKQIYFIFGRFLTQTEFDLLYIPEWDHLEKGDRKSFISILSLLPKLSNKSLFYLLLLSDNQLTLVIDSAHLNIMDDKINRRFASYLFLVVNKTYQLLKQKSPNDLNDIEIVNLLEHPILIDDFSFFKICKKYFKRGFETKGLKNIPLLSVDFNKLKYDSNSKPLIYEGI